MSIETHEISFSFDHPDNILNPLLMLLQQSLNRAKMRSSRALPLLNAREVLVIDGNTERSRYVAYLLTSAGFRPLVEPTALEAFTRFLKIPFAPCAVILGQEDANDTFFLQRFLRQLSQKYDWDAPLVRLHVQMPAQPGQPSQSSIPLTPLPAQGDIPRKNSMALPAQNSATRNNSTSLPAREESSSGVLTPLSSVQMRDEVAARTTSPLPPVQTTTAPLSRLDTAAHTQESGRLERERPTIRLEGQNIGRYQIHSALGVTGESDVYLTYDRLRETNVALKVVPTKAIIYHTGEHEEKEVHYFQREADLLASLKHPAILPILTTGETYISGFPFIYKVMPHCEEGSFADWLRQRGNARLLTLQEIMPVVAQLADVLQFMHEHHTTYQNFKLTNMLVSQKAKNIRQLKLTLSDFVVVQDGTYVVQSTDSFLYVAPEQWSGFSLPASDQYSLAVIIYELLAGRPPFQGNSEQIMKRMHVTMPPQPVTIYNAAISAPTNKVLLRALAKRPEERFESITAFADALQRCVN